VHSLTSPRCTRPEYDAASIAKVVRCSRFAQGILFAQDIFAARTKRIPETHYIYNLPSARKKRSVAIHSPLATPYFPAIYMEQGMAHGVHLPHRTSP
jgi:hypothetical protein